MTFDTISPAVAHRPSVAFPPHRMTLDEMVGLAGEHFGSSRDFRRIERMIRNTQIAERRFVLPRESLGSQGGLAERSERYFEHALAMARDVSTRALETAQLSASEVDLVITISSTGFIMPSLDAYLINEIGLRPDVKRMPIAQLGCSGGASAIVKALDHTLAYPSSRILIIAVEVSSACFFPEWKDVTSAVCASIFGDGAAACVVTGREATAAPGLALRRAITHTVPNSEHFIRYRITDRGYHLTLDKGVMHSIPVVAPVLDEMLRGDGSSGAEIDFLLAHTGGKRILDSLVRALGCPEELATNSRASLREVGNTASVSVLDVMQRAFDNERPRLHGDENRGLLVAFGPGFTMDACTVAWEAAA